MNSLPNEIKFTYIIAIIVMMFFVGFIIFVVVLYNRKQQLYLKEKQLKEVEYENEILQKELEKQKLLEEERHRISADMHDELGAGISALKLHAEFMKQKIDEKDELHTDINDILSTSEEMNLAMREMLWSLNIKNDNILSFVDYVSVYAEKFFRKTSIKITIQNHILTNSEIPAETRRNLFLCVKEALNNAYKHSNASEIKLKFSQTQMHFSVEVEDDGIGGLENKKSGNGLHNMNLRMSKIRGEVQFDSVEKGTKIGLQVPLQL